MKNFIELSNVLGSEKATDQTVRLFNTCLPIEKDEKGQFVIAAIKPHLNGVIVEKQYLSK